MRDRLFLFDWEEPLAMAAASEGDAAAIRICEQFGLPVRQAPQGQLELIREIVREEIQRVLGDA